MIKWLKLLFHWHQWEIIGVHADQNERYDLKTASFQWKSSIVVRCAICTKLNSKRVYGSFQSLNTGDAELEELRKMIH